MPIRQLPNFEYTCRGRDDGNRKSNKGWDAVLPRICSSAKLEVLRNNKQLYFFNVHFDNWEKLQEVKVLS